jgi:hypothetical protein
MDKQRLQEIKKDTNAALTFAILFLRGDVDVDGYDGADGARTVFDLCHTILGLVDEWENDHI